MTIISIHMIQNHAPSNLNRDDNGDPKDCFFGGTRRARLSSQALKRSIRWSPIFRSYFGTTDEEQEQYLAFRTTLMPEEIRKRLAHADYADRLDDVKAQIVETAIHFGRSESGKSDAIEEDASSERGKAKGKSKQGNTAAATLAKTKQLMFLTSHELDQLTSDLATLYRQSTAPDMKKFKQKADEQYVPHTVDIAMFGRMTTSSPFKNIEAAVQIAHALSTHTVAQEFDYYTAVDDISGESGAGFIGETAFNSATYYKYCSIHWEGLCQNLADDEELSGRAVRALLHAMMTAIPSGKQNSFATHNLPDLVLVEQRDVNIPLSYANAFVKPVRATAGGSLVEASVAALEAYIPAINTMHGLHAERRWLGTVPFTLAGSVQCQSLDEILAWLPPQKAS